MNRHVAIGNQARTARAAAKSPGFPLTPLSGALGALLAISLPGAGYGDDSFFGVDAAGLRLSEAEGIAISSERLEVSFSRIKIRYRFTNLDDAPKSGSLGFPIVHPGLFDKYEDDGAATGARRILDSFAIKVDGNPVTPEGVAYQFFTLPPVDYDIGDRAGGEQRGAIDVTALLKSADVPIDDPSANLVEILEGANIRDRVLAGLPRSYRDGFPYSLRGWIVPWWTQGFPARATLKVEHSYDTAPGGYPLTGYVIQDAGGRFTLPKEEIEQTREHIAGIRERVKSGLEELYGSGSRIECSIGDDFVPDYLRRTLKDRLSADPSTGTGDNPVVQEVTFMSYILETARSWTGPIGNFEMTVDGEGKPVLFCFPGPIETIDSDRFVYRVQAFDFDPKANLELSRLE